MVVLLNNSAVHPVSWVFRVAFLYVNDVNIKMFSNPCQCFDFFSIGECVIALVVLWLNMGGNRCLEVIFDVLSVSTQDVHAPIIVVAGDQVDLIAFTHSTTKILLLYLWVVFLNLPLQSVVFKFV
jgi:hypothetical protein